MEKKEETRTVGNGEHVEMHNKLVAKKNKRPNIPLKECWQHTKFKDSVKEMLGQ